MALLHTHFFAESIGMQGTMDVILPQRPRSRPLPVLWLLHGLSDDHSIWQRRTSIERYVEPMDLAVIMPNVHRSFYADMHHGFRYWTLLSEELPRIAANLFPLSTRREDNFAAGLSMGGYGAFKLALARPDRYAAAASLSGALDVGRRWRGNERIGEMDLVFADDPTGGPDDLLHLAARLAAAPGPRPRLFQCCGTEDFLYADNLRFRDHARQVGLEVDYREAPGGHSWTFWDNHIQDVLRWLALATPPAP